MLSIKNIMYFFVMLFEKEVDEQHARDSWKIVYIAPVKALCSERVADWRNKLAKVTNLHSAGQSALLRDSRGLEEQTSKGSIST